MLMVKNLVKMYDAKAGLKQANFTAWPGDVLALVGPNGSGKTTLLHVLCDVHKADSGQCTLNGTPLALCKADIGFMPETPYLIDALTGIEFLRFIAGLKGLPSLDSIDEHMAAFGVSAFATKRMKTLSQGQRKRFSLLAALLGEPPLLILDEPTNGLDTESLIKLKGILLERAKHKKITLLSSHVLDFVKNTANKVVFIKAGETVAEMDASCDVEQEYVAMFM